MVLDSYKLLIDTLRVCHGFRFILHLNLVRGDEKHCRHGIA